MKKYIEKVNTLLEALPYIKEFYGKTVVVKYGGSAMVENELKRSFAQDLILMKFVGINPVVVHGGGPRIGEFLKRLGKETRFVQGIRVTDDETMDVVEMVLVGKVNKEIVGFINSLGGRAVGLSGKDGGLIRGRKLDPIEIKREGLPPEIIDLGRAGDVFSINPEIISLLDRERFIPVIAPVGVGDGGETYNINADVVAGRIAAALKAEKLILLTDVDGVMDKKGGLLSSISREEVNSLIKEDVITGGMIPKVSCCIDALRGGVRKTHIIDGRIPHALLLEVFTDAGIGTEIS